MRKIFDYLTYIKLLFRKFNNDGLQLRDWDELDRIHQDLFGTPYLEDN